MAPHDVAPDQSALPVEALARSFRPDEVARTDQDPPQIGELFARSARLMAQLRSPEGCPWDREQTPETIRRYTLEESYEVLDAIERKNPEDLCEELGDLLLQVLFYAQMAEESGQFILADVVDGLNQKLIRRHPHVFGEQASAAAGNRTVASGMPVTDAQGVKQKWDQIKQAEKLARGAASAGEPGSSAGRMGGILRNQPALLEAHKLGSAARKCGFDWPDARGLLAKIREEVDEVEAEMKLAQQDSEATRALQLEVGDLLFVTASLARHLHTDGETALRDANAKFRSRFAAMEEMEAAEAEGTGAKLLAVRPLEQRSLEELEELWQRAKEREAKPPEAAHAPGSAKSTRAGE